MIKFQFFVLDVFCFYSSWSSATGNLVLWMLTITTGVWTATTQLVKQGKSFLQYDTLYVGTNFLNYVGSINLIRKSNCFYGLGIVRSFSAISVLKISANISTIFVFIFCVQRKLMACLTVSLKQISCHLKLETYFELLIFQSVYDKYLRRK